MNIAVAYNEGRIHEHFGHCESFAIYSFDGFDGENYEKRIIDSSDRHGHSAMAELMVKEDVAAVICGNMGNEAKALLLSSGIVPIAGYMGDADEAAVLLMTGRLPIIEDYAGCGGGCGGCSGHCGDEGGDCGCGCEGHCH